VPHLTYVGDATIGEHSNIGASSVFVNYDGVRKQRTVVGSHVRTGSDNTFVAPVQVGDGAPHLEAHGVRGGLGAARPRSGDPCRWERCATVAPSRIDVLQFERTGMGCNERSHGHAAP
jgi:hypothetical protein